MKSFIRAAGAGLFCIAISFAQETPRFTFDLGGGFTPGVGETGRGLNTGWNIDGGVGYNFSRFFATKIDLGYNDLGFNFNTLNSIGVPTGSLRVFSATLDPVFHTNLSHRFDLYLTGGGGLFHRDQEFGQPSGAVVTGYYPAYGFVTSGGAPTSFVAGSYASNKPGVDVGIGVEVGTKFHGKLFAEAKFDHIYDRYPTNYLPVTFGFRW